MCRERPRIASDQRIDTWAPSNKRMQVTSAGDDYLATISVTQQRRIADEVDHVIDALLTKQDYGFAVERDTILFWLRGLERPGNFSIEACLAIRPPFVIATLFQQHQSKVEPRNGVPGSNFRALLKQACAPSRSPR